MGHACSLGCPQQDRAQWAVGAETGSAAAKYSRSSAALFHRKLFWTQLALSTHP